MWLGGFNPSKCVLDYWIFFIDEAPWNLEECSFKLCLIYSLSVTNV